jgi:ethanolamine ammonia-lyase small subunit
MKAPDNPKSDLAPTSRRDPWRALASQTPARIALGRAGGSLRTESLLELRLAHAGARDAVHAVFDPAGLEAELRDRGLATERLATAAADRMTYLARPDLGKILSPESEKFLGSKAASWGRRDLVILVSDGLSASAAQGNAADTVEKLVRILTASGWTHYPVLIVPFARVKLQDSVGAILGAGHSVILLGERPGLSAHDSLGAYLTFEPRAERTDADRNCVSNIREGGLPAPAAAGKLAAMLMESRRMGLSGTELRDLGGEGRPRLQHGPKGVH